LGHGELGPHLTQCGQGSGYLHAKFHLDPSSRLATIDMGRGLYGNRHAGKACAHKFRKWGRLLCPFGAGSRSPSNTMWPGPRSTCMPSFIFIHPTVNHNTQRHRQTDREERQTGQRSDRIGRTVLQTVAQKSKNSHISATVLTDRHEMWQDDAG